MNMNTVITEFGKYSGNIVPSANYDPPNTIRMSTSIRDFPFRVMAKHSISEIDGVPFSFTVVPDQVTMVTGSKGDVYTVRTSHGITTCTCPGFGFRKMCKHILSLEVKH